MRLVQFLDAGLGRSVACVAQDGRSLQLIGGVQSTYDLAMEAVRRNQPLERLVTELLTPERVSYDAITPSAQPSGSLASSPRSSQIRSISSAAPGRSPNLAHSRVLRMF